jgi:hypothetical protein
MRRASPPETFAVRVMFRCEHPGRLARWLLLTRSMVSQTSRAIDDEIVNLSGGLFEEASFLALTMPLIDVLGPDPAPPPRRVAQQRAAIARRISWTVAASASACLAMGLAAAGEGSRPTPPPEREPPAGAAGDRVMASFVPVGWMLVSEPEPDDASELPVSAQAGVAPAAVPPQRRAEMPRPQPAHRMAEPSPAMHLSLPASPPQPNLLAALAAPEHDLSRAAAAIAIAVAARGAARCLEPGDTRTTMSVQVTFAPSGHATSAAVIGGPFLGTATGSCIARALSAARVPPFDAPPVSASTSVHLR